MTKLSSGPLWKENNKWENVGLCYILSMTNLCGVRGGVEPPLCCANCVVGGSPGGLKGAGSPPLRGPRKRHGKKKLDLILGWANLLMVFGPWYSMLRHV